jgi:hypothetical protein
MDDAVAFVEARLSQLRPLLPLKRQGGERSGWANIAADCAVKIAISGSGIEPGLENPAPSIFQKCRLQNLRRALGNA